MMTTMCRRLPLAALAAGVVCASSATAQEASTGQIRNFPVATEYREAGLPVIEQASGPDVEAAFERWKAIHEDVEAGLDTFRRAAEHGNARERRNVEAHLAFFESFHDMDWETTLRVADRRFVQHVPNAGTGLLWLVNTLSCCWPPGNTSGQTFVMNMTNGAYHYIVDGDVVFHQRTRALGPVTGEQQPTMSLDMFTFKDGKVAEHWDLFMPAPLRTVSGRQMFDEAEEFAEPFPTSDAIEAANKQLVYDFLNMSFGLGDVRGAADMYIGDVFYQHDPWIADGKEAWVEYFSGPDGVTLHYDIQLMAAQNDKVGVFSRVMRDGIEILLWNQFRVRDGKIVEHWDMFETSEHNIPENFVHIEGQF